MNLPGSVFSPLDAVKMIVRDTQMSPRIAFKDLQKMVAIWVVSKSSNLQLNTTSMPTNYLEGMPEESLVFHLATNSSAWSSLNTAGADWNQVLCQ